MLTISATVLEVERRQPAENFILKVQRKVEGTVMLFHILNNHEKPEIRQMAAVLVRRKLASHWTRIPSAEQTAIKATLLHVIVNDSSSSVRNSAAVVAGALSRVLLPLGQWNDLLPFLQQAATSTQADLRDASMLILQYMAEFMASLLVKSLASLAPILDTILRGQSHPVATLRAMRVVEKLLGAAYDDVDNDDGSAASEDVSISSQYLSVLVAGLFAATEGFLARGDFDSANEALSVIADAVEEDPKAIPLPELFTLILRIMQAPYQGAGAVPARLRYSASSSVFAILEYRPKALLKCRGVVEQLVETAFSLVSVGANRSPEQELLEDEAADDMVGDDEMEDERTSLGFASGGLGCQILDMMATTLPATNLAPLVFPRIEEAVRSNQPTAQWTAITSLGSLIEGLQETFRVFIHQLVDMLVTVFASGNGQLVGACCYCLGQILEHLYDVVTERSGAQLAPYLIAALRSNSPSVLRRAAYALELWADVALFALPTAMRPALAEAAIAAVAHLQGRARYDLLNAVASLTAAIHEAASMVKGRQVDAVTQSTAEQALQICSTAVSLGLSSGENDWAYALNAAGRIAATVCQSQALAVAAVCRQVLVGPTASDAELSEAAFSALVEIAGALDAQFPTPLAVEILQLALAAIALTDDITVAGGSTHASALHIPNMRFNGNGNDDDEEEESEDDDEDDMQGGSLKIRSSIVDLKAVAFDCLAAVLKSQKAYRASFSADISQALTAAIEAGFEHLHDRVRASASRALAGYAIFEGNYAPAVMKICELAPSEPDGETVAVMASSLVHMLEAVGLVAFRECETAILGLLDAGLRMRLFCQEHDFEGADSGAEDDEEDDEEGMHDENSGILAMTGFVELGVTLAELGGHDASWAQGLIQFFFAALLPNLEAAVVSSLKTAAAGGVADGAYYLKPQLLPTALCQQFLSALGNLAQNMEEDIGIRRNATYALGTLAVQNPGAAQPVLSSLIGYAAAVIKADAGDNTIRDNAIGLAARLAYTFGSQDCIRIVIEALPIREDQQEWIPVSTAIAWSLTSGGAPADLISPLHHWGLVAFVRSAMHPPKAAFQRDVVVQTAMGFASGGGFEESLSLLSEEERNLWEALKGGALPERA